VALATTTYAAPHLLILDEPSNHLDLGGVEALLNALKGYSGAVVLVSHDQHLVSSFADIVYAVGAKKVRRLEGGMAQYVKELKVESRKAGSS
jgi:ATP-binding cassette subfamily F protein 3